MGNSIIVFFQDLYQVVLPFHVFEGLHGGHINYGPGFAQISMYYSLGAAIHSKNSEKSEK